MDQAAGAGLKYPYGEALAARRPKHRLSDDDMLTVERRCRRSIQLVPKAEGF